jgi:hypothetical protein
VLKSAKGDYTEHPVLYVNAQLRYHMGFSSQELKEMTDQEWAQQYAILAHIRTEEAKQKAQQGL